MIRIGDLQFRDVLRVLDRQHPEPQGVEQFENRGIRADTQRKRERRDREKAGTHPQQSRATADVPPKIPHDNQTPAAQCG